MPFALLQLFVLTLKDPFTVHELLNAATLFRVFLQALVQQVFELLRHLRLSRYFQRLLDDSLNELVIALSDGKRQLSVNKLKHYNSQRPNITFPIIVFVLQYFRGHSDRSAAVGFEHKLLLIDLFSKAKISQFNYQVPFEQNVGQFNIPMDNVFWVYFSNSISNAEKYLLHCIFGYQWSVVLLQILLQVAFLTKLKHQIKIVRCLQIVIELYNIRVGNAFYYGYLFWYHLLLILGYFV